jgi:integrase
MSLPTVMPRLPLQDLALALASLRSYNRSLRSFLSYTRLSPQQLLSEPAARLDRLLAVYIQHSYDTASPFTYAAHALHAVIYHRPDLKARLFISRQCLTGWERVKKSVSHPPLTWELTVVIACTLARSGFHAPAVAMLVAFDCYLRVGELTRIRLRDVIMPSDPRMGLAHTGMAVCLAQTKTGRNQSVALQRPDVASVLSAWVTSLPRSSAVDGGDPRVFAFSPDYLRRLMRDACDRLGVGHTAYVPHSLRHGGATADFLLTGSIERVQFRGRWKSMESVRTYVQTARALLAAQEVPAALNTLGGLLSDALAPTMIHLLGHVPAVTPARRARRVTFDRTA